MKGNTLEENLQKLQDIKFYIYDHAKCSLDYHQIHILTIKLAKREINLYNYLKNNKGAASTQEIAQKIICENNL